jgi:hypothetical protein
MQLNYVLQRKEPTTEEYDKASEKRDILEVEGGPVTVIPRMTQSDS